MDKSTIDIFRSWNWPVNGQETFSKRPSPYSVAKNTSLAVSSVYNSWHRLFDKNVVRRVILLPSDQIVKRSVAIFPNASYDDFTSIKSRIDQLHFLELLHFGHIYQVGGEMNIFAKGLGVMAAEVVNSSKEVFKTVAQQISRITANDAEPILLPTNSRPEELDAKYVSIMRELAYSDLYRIEIGRTALRLNTSYKTAKRRMDDILRSKSIMAYPLLNQSSIEGFQIAFIYAKYEGNCSDEDFLKVLKEMPVISERYLLYRFLNGHLTMIIYYNSIGDLESSCKELEHFFPSFLLLTRFETYFNEVVTSSIAEIF